MGFGRQSAVTGGVLAAIAASAFASGPGEGRVIHKEVTVAAPPADVWRVWTTNDGITSFFGRGADVELKVGGKFEVYFLMDAPAGSRGSEGCKVLAYLPERMLAFSWNAPPSIPVLRDAGARTQVVLRFEPDGEGRTHVDLTQHGLGTGEDWDQYYDYFDSAWGRVLTNLKGRFADSRSEDSGADASAEGGHEKKHWVYFIRPARADFFENRLESDLEPLQGHVAYIRQLQESGALLLAGPCEDPAQYPRTGGASALEMPTPGIVVFEADDADAARKVMEGDPAVRAGVFRARVNRFHLAFKRN